jgi:hypothetical protein
MYRSWVPMFTNPTLLQSKIWFSGRIFRIVSSCKLRILILRYLSLRIRIPWVVVVLSFCTLKIFALVYP